MKCGLFAVADCQSKNGAAFIAKNLDTFELHVQRKEKKQTESKSHGVAAKLTHGLTEGTSQLSNSADLS